MLEKSPDDRFQSATELEDFLDKYLLHLHQPFRFPEPCLRLEPVADRQPLVKRALCPALSGVCLLAVAISAWWFLGLPTAVDSANTSTESRSPNSLPVDSALFSMESIQEKYDLGDAQRFAEQCWELRFELEMVAGPLEDRKTLLSKTADQRHAGDDRALLQLDTLHKSRVRLGAELLQLESLNSESPKRAIRSLD